MGRTENKNFTFEVSTEGDGLIFWHLSLKCKRILQKCWLPEADSIYEKVKSKTKPKTFAKANIRCGKRRYDNSTAFYEEYFGQNCEKLVAAIKAYKQHNGSHKKDEHYLAELLK